MSHRAPSRQRDLRQWWPAGYGAVLGIAVFMLARDAMPDDAYIHAAFARNLLERGQWAITPGIPVNTATSPLWVWLLVIVGGPLSSVIAAIAVLLAGCLAAVAEGLYRMRGRWAALLGTGLVATAPVMNSAVGMETALAVTLLVWLVERAAAGSWRWAGLLGGLLVLTRPDLAVAVLAVVVVLARRDRKAWSALAVAAVVPLPWYLLSWVVFGSAWPDTVALKSTMGGWGPDGSVHLWNAVPLYAQSWPIATWLTVTVVVLGAAAVPVALERRDRVALALAAGGVADFVFIAASGGPPAHYYAGPMVCGLGLAGVLIGVRGRLGWVPLAIAVAATAAFTVSFVPHWTEGLAPFRTNWATNVQYAAIAEGLPRDGLVINEGEIGAVAFHCLEHGCRVVDGLLADPSRTEYYVERWRTEHPWTAANYLWRETPVRPDYRWSVTYRPGGDPTGPGRWPITYGDSRSGAATLSAR